MSYRYDSRGIQPRAAGVFKLLPPGRYLVEIVTYEERQTKNKDYCVVIDVKVIKPNVVNDVPVFGELIKFHYITFLPPDSKGAGIAIHFLKSIGEPWEQAEDLDIEPSRWVGKVFVAKVGIDKYETGDGKERQKNVIETVEPYELAAGVTNGSSAPPPSTVQRAAPKSTDEEIPF